MSEETRGSARRRAYDKGFRYAVTRGFLTVRQATERGSRASFAHKLIDRHRMSLPLASMVADNRIPLPVAVRFNAENRRKSPWMRWRLESAVLIMCLLCYAMLLQGRRAARGDHADRAMPPPVTSVPVPVATNPAPVPAGISIRRGANGELTKVVAETPIAVLDTFCASLGDGATPVRVVRGPRRWAGYYRRHGQLYEITIYQESRVRGWRTGDAEGRVVEDSPDEPG